MAEILSDGSYVDDRHDVVNSGFWDGREAVIANLRALAEAAPTSSVVVATRGERLVLTRMCSPNRNQQYGEFSSDMFVLAEIDPEERISAQIGFNMDDIDAAYDELETRYLAGEAAEQACAWSAIVASYAALNQGELPSTTTDFVDIDHRRGAAMAPGELIKFLRSALDQTRDLSIRIAAVHRLNQRGAVVTHAATGTSPEGFEAEWREVSILTVDGDKLNHCEVFDEADLDATLARFDELTGEDRSK
jgi:hypothetical protein